MDPYIQQWLDIIENMANENTYKLAWGRSLLECVRMLDIILPFHTFSFTEIAHRMLRYYWNQVAFFNLRQGPSKKPILVQETEKLIKFVNEKRRSNTPLWFDHAESILLQYSNVYETSINRMAKVLGHDVAWRFMRIKGENHPLYTLDLNQREVGFTMHQVMILKEYAYVLSQLLNYRWAQLLEKFNQAPEIALKVKGLSQEKLRRSSLRQYRDILLSTANNGSIIDFYTGQPLSQSEISVDHVIPWSFMYSDDIWNLVLTSKSYNSTKSNIIPSDSTIKRLQVRNKNLLKQLPQETKYYRDLKMAIDLDYVEKFYTICKYGM